MFRLFIGAQLTSQIADATVTILLANELLFSTQQGPTVTRLSALVFTSAAPLIVAGPLGGIIADRFTRRAILSIGQIVRSALVVLALIGIENGYEILAVIAWGGGLCTSRVLYTSRAASLRHLVRNHELVAADSVSLIASSVAGSIGVSIGLTLSMFGAWGLLQASFLHLFSSVLYSRVSANLGGGRDHIEASWHETLQHLKQQKIRFAILSTSIHRFWFGVIFSSSALMADTWGNGSAVGYLGMAAANGMGSFIGNVTAETANETVPRRTLTVLVYGGTALVCATTGLVGHPVCYAGGLVLIAFLFQNLRVCSDATIQSNAKRGAGGREFAAYDITYNLMFLVGILLGLWLFPMTGGQGSMFMASSATLISTFVLAQLKRDVEVTSSETSTQKVEAVRS